jgi:hypothetical protein
MLVLNGQNCISTASGIVTLYEQPCTAPVESGLGPLSTGAVHGRSQGVNTILVS